MSDRRSRRTSLPRRVPLDRIIDAMRAAHPPARWTWTPVSTEGACRHDLTEYGRRHGVDPPPPPPPDRAARHSVTVLLAPTTRHTTLDKQPPPARPTSHPRRTTSAGGAPGQRESDLGYRRIHGELANLGTKSAPPRCGRSCRPQAWTRHRHGRGPPRASSSAPRPTPSSPATCSTSTPSP